jgi:hypothetical protein
MAAEKRIPVVMDLRVSPDWLYADEEKDFSCPVF